MRVLTVVGARPQFVKAAAVSRALRKEHDEILVHTGQHYDDNMSAVFFRELDLPAPDECLNVGSGSHGDQTARMLVGLEASIVRHQPDIVMVYGDTNSTLAGSLAAAKLRVPIAHVEAGLRSFNRAMPEEINRILTDHMSALLFCPGQAAARNLGAEGIHEGVHVVGDVMADVLSQAVPLGGSEINPLEGLGLTQGQYLLVTVHRAQNTDDPRRLRGLIEAMAALDEEVIFPVHPRTMKMLANLDVIPGGRVRLIDPVGYADMVRLERSARMILTDSGGVQKEAYWLGIPCVTLRDETEWVETVDAGWNVVVGTDPERIIDAVRSFTLPASRPALYGDGCASARIASVLEEYGAGTRMKVEELEA